MNNFQAWFAISVHCDSGSFLPKSLNDAKRVFVVIVLGLEVETVVLVLGVATGDLSFGVVGLGVLKGVLGLGFFSTSGLSKPSSDSSELSISSSVASSSD